MKSEKPRSLIRTIYLYLFALVGLALLTTGTVRFVDMGLDASINLAMILVGLPLYLYHWQIIGRETRGEEQEM